MSPLPQTKPERFSNLARAGFLVVLLGAVTMSGCSRVADGPPAQQPGVAPAPTSAPASGSATAPTPTPVTRVSMGFSPLRTELGELPWHSTVPFELWFENPSPAPVEVAAVNSSCGCMRIDQARLIGTVVPPGGRLKIEGVLEVGPHVGKRTREVQLLLKNGPVYIGYLEYTGFATYTVSPESVDFRHVRVEREGHAEPVRVWFHSKTARIVGDPQVDVPWLQAAVQPRAVGGTWIVLNVVPEELPVGQHDALVRVLTDDPYRPQFQIPVQVTGVAPVRPVPAQVFLAPGQEQQVELRSPQGFQIPIQEVSCADPMLDVSILPSRIKVVVRWKEGAASDSAAIYIVDDEGREVRVPVFRVR